MTVRQAPSICCSGRRYDGLSRGYILSNDSINRYEVSNTDIVKGSPGREVCFTRYEDFHTNDFK
jgi:hypothetical protein